MKSLIVPFILLLNLSIAQAEMREWTSSTYPDRKIRGELQKVEGKMVTLKLEHGRVVKFELSKLSEEDQEFARSGGKPKMETTERKEGPESTPAEVVESFKFGEDPDEVYVRLNRNPGLRGGVNEILRGRTGLNGMYFIEPGGVKYPLYFDFGEDAEALVEVSLQSAGFSQDEYDSKLKESWTMLRKSLEAKYGEPALRGAFPDKSTITEGLSMSTDVWKTEHGEVYVGIGQTDGSFSCVIRIREKGFLAQ